ncbi:MAG: hypothetical protein IKZ36_03680, partial [Kiritimatiellae bacterium]|nr:hypothetical protein [Kiritimatiellia bacterium]
MPNLTPFEIALLILGAVLVAALAAIMWWRLAGERVKALIAGWLALPLLWKIVLPMVFAGVSAPALFKGDDDKEIELQKLEYFQEIFAAGVYFTPEVAEALMANNPENLVNPVQSKKSISVSDEDIARGYWLESVATNLMYSYECPSNGVRHLPWYMAGGHTAFKRYDFESAFPLGTNLLEFVTVFQDGRICRTPRDRIPLLKPHDGMFAFVRHVSDFWTLFEPTRRIFTWHNVRDYESSDDVYSMQIEHFANGDFIVRLNEIEKLYRYINPDDWDDDGLANEIDASPKINDGDFFGVASPLPEGVNPQAYYWVELCATGVAKAATIRITCDGVSDLGNHVIIARANQVCRVPLLIGAEYTLESSS